MIRRHRFAYTLLITLLLIGCTSKNLPTHNFWPENKSPRNTGQLISSELFTRPDYMMYVTDKITTFHYAEACAAYGVAKFAGTIHDSLLIDKLVNRYKDIVDSGLISSVGHVDVNVYGIVPFELYMQTGNKKMFNEGKQLADQQWEDTLPNGMTIQTRYWIDDIYMISSLQTQAFRATGDTIYLDRAALEIKAYLDKLQQPNGLFYHGPHAPFFWGRGNGWVAAGLAELISVLPESNPYYPAIIDGYKKMMAALLQYQTDDGMWRQLIDNNDAWKETSGTAMFGYALLCGVKRGILKDKAYTDAYQKAWLALCDYVQPDGKLSEVCVGTGQSTDAKYYLDRPRTEGDFHGQAPMLWFAAALLSK